MEKIIKQSNWFTLYEITAPIFSAYKPYVFVELGVKKCPCCNHEYCVRFTNEFNCLSCRFKYIVKTPIRVKIKNLIRTIL